MSGSAAIGSNTRKLDSLLRIVHTAGAARLFAPRKTWSHGSAAFPRPWPHLNPSSTTAAAAELSKRELHTSPTVQQQILTPPKGIAKLQSFDYTSMAACVSELRRVWVPARVEETLQFTPHSVALRLRTLEHYTWLYLCWHPTLAHVGVSEEGPPRSAGALAQAFSFGEQLHSVLKGLVLTEVAIPQRWERTAALSFAQRPGDAPEIVVYLEIIGKYSNIILTQGNSNSVLAAGHQVGSKMSSFRAIRVGKPYALPPIPSGIPPDVCTSCEEWKRAVMMGDAPSSTSILARCVRTFLGVSPSLMRELCSSAGVSHLVDPATLDAASWDAAGAAVYAKWTRWLERMAAEDFLCSTSRSGEISMLGAFLEGVVESPLALMRDYYGGFEAFDEFERAKHRILKGVTGSVTRLTKKIQSLESQAADPTVHEATQRQADLIMANLHAIPAGATSFSAEDWDTGEAIKISLDPEKTFIECAEGLYSKARKQRRAGSQVGPLIEDAQEQVKWLQDVELMLQQLSGRDLGDLAALQEMEGELVTAGFVKPPPGAALAEKAASKARKATKKSIKRGEARADDEGMRHYVSPGGLTVILGRTAQQNDTLTMRLAKPNDVWLHARGVPGAHCMVRVPAGKTASDEDIQFAADLSAYFSKSRLDGKVNVTVANPADIAKPKGAKPGQVMVYKERVVVGRPFESAAAAAEEADL